MLLVSFSTNFAALSLIFLSSSSTDKDSFLLLEFFDFFLYYELSFELFNFVLEVS